MGKQRSPGVLGLRPRVARERRAGVCSLGCSVPGSGFQGPFCTVKRQEGDLEGFSYLQPELYSVYYDSRKGFVWITRFSRYKI